uniref:Uncharacterized protein n=1 Tax=Oryza meridionalis TaxID=40149 RepID=A0A0E0FC95_9ORYZ
RRGRKFQIRHRILLSIHRGDAAAVRRSIPGEEAAGFPVGAAAEAGTGAAKSLIKQIGFGSVARRRRCL